jgi:hypothetical protein
MKFLLALSFAVCTAILSAQDIAAIEYSPDRDFNWSMFKGKINPRHIAEMGSNTGAVTVSSLSYKSQVYGRTAKIRVSALFNPTESWTRYPKLNHPNEALNHEKRHFDICEIYARKIRKAITLAHLDRKNFNQQVDYIFKKIVVDYRAAQNRYDRETKHSIDEDQQERWNAIIDAELKSLAEYSNPLVSIALN